MINATHLIVKSCVVLSWKEYLAVMAYMPGWILITSIWCLVSNYVINFIVISVHLILSVSIEVGARSHYIALCDRGISYLRVVKHST